MQKRSRRKKLGIVLFDFNLSWIISLNWSSSSPDWVPLNKILSFCSNPSNSCTSCSEYNSKSLISPSRLYTACSHIASSKFTIAFPLTHTIKAGQLCLLFTTISSALDDQCLAHNRHSKYLLNKWSNSILRINEEEYKQGHPNYRLSLNGLGLLGCTGNQAFSFFLFSFLFFFLVINWESLGPDRYCADFNTTESCIYLSLKKLKRWEFWILFVLQVELHKVGRSCILRHELTSPNLIQCNKQCQSG